jgi:spore coat polysaccharide biosynthesis protein SpsF
MYFKHQENTGSPLVLLITQARMGSTRLPGKIFEKVGNKALLQIHLERIRESKKISGILVATTTSPSDDIVYEQSIKWGYQCYRGSENDVLDRYFQAAQIIKPDWVVRVTSDCPLIDSELIDEVVAYALDKNFEYCANNLMEQYPDGQDIEIFTFEALKRAWKEADKQSEREHVTPYIRNRTDNLGMKLFKVGSYDCEADYSKIRMTVDEPKDLQLMKQLIGVLGVDKSWRTYSRYMIQNGLTTINEDIIRNEGYLKSLEKDKTV